MHSAVLTRAIGQIVRLEDRQRVHVGAKPDAVRRIAGAQHADDAGLADIAMHFAAELGEFCRDRRRRALLLETDLGMGMEVAPPCGHLLMEGADIIEGSGRRCSNMHRGKAAHVLA